MQDYVISLKIYLTTVTVSQRSWSLKLKKAGDSKCGRNQQTGLLKYLARFWGKNGRNGVIIRSSGTAVQRYSGTGVVCYTARLVVVNR